MFGIVYLSLELSKTTLLYFNYLIGNEKPINGTVIDIVRDHGDGFFINKYQIEYNFGHEKSKKCFVSGLGQNLEFKKYQIGDKVKLLKNNYGLVILDKYRMNTYFLIHFFLITLIFISIYRIVQAINSHQSHP